MLVIGCVVSIVDNLMRPILAKHAKLELDGLVLFVAMLGGIAMFGGFGLLLGPLFVRLGSEGLTLMKEARQRRNSTSAPNGAL
jgi:predicted PurR-regulated permease PerM